MNTGTLPKSLATPGTAIFTKTEPLNVRYGFPAEVAQQYQLAEDRYGNPDKEGRIVAVASDDLWVVPGIHL